MSKQENVNIKEKNKVLVTGAAGFIGSHLVDYLLEKGHEVVCLVKPGEDTRWLKDLDVSLVYGDLTDKNSLYKAVKGVSYIYHLGANMGGAWHNPSYVFKVNYEGTKNIVDVCLESGIHLKRFLFTSSVTAIGATGDTGTANEESLPKPHSAYGESKLMVEKYLMEIRDKIPSTIVILPLVYGPRCFKALYMLFKIVNKGIRLQMGKSHTSLGFVKDIVEGMVTAANSPAAVGQKYLLGEDRAYSSREIIENISEAIGKKTVKIPVPNFILYSAAFLLEKFALLTGTSPIIWKDDIHNYLNLNWRFSMKKAKEELNFTAKYPLAKGLKITADWYKKEGFI